MEHGVNVDLTSKCFLAADGNCGTKSFTIDETQVPLEFDGRKSHVKISKPTQEDCEILSVHKLISSHPLAS